MCFNFVAKFPDYHITNVPSDGNCQFVALSLQLERSDPHEVRREVVEYLKSHAVCYVTHVIL